MKKRVTPFHILIAALLPVSYPTIIEAQAQTAASLQAPGPVDATDGMAFAKTMQNDMELLMEIEMELTGGAVKDLPFSAKFSIETYQVLADGTHIARKTGGALYRDGLGRVRQEITLPLPLPASASAELGNMVIMSDPSTGAHWTLMPASKTAMKMIMPASPVEKMNGDSNTEKNFHAIGVAGGSAENLGTQNMEGVSVSGTRTAHAIPVGQLGNDQPLQLVTEQWYSPELHMTVFLKRDDPMSGTKTLRVTDIRRAEPDAAIFNVPADYTVQGMMIPGDTEAKKASQPKEER